MTDRNQLMYVLSRAELRVKAAASLIQAASMDDEPELLAAKVVQHLRIVLDTLERNMHGEKE
jgi:hypothetical protein